MQSAGYERKGRYKSVYNVDSIGETVLEKVKHHPYLGIKSRNEISVQGYVCVDAKVKYGAAMLNGQNMEQKKELNDIKINLLKRTLEMPYCTLLRQLPFNMTLVIVDLDLDVYMERVIYV